MQTSPTEADADLQRMSAIADWVRSLPEERTTPAPTTAEYADALFQCGAMAAAAAEQLLVEIENIAQQARG